MEELAVVWIGGGFKHIRQLREQGGEAATRERPSGGRLAAVYFTRAQNGPCGEGGGPLVYGCAHVMMPFIESIY
ncbi:MAG: hypothetical protein GEV05_15315 [Betaproteobacteria bacterium]|nr:hypothetical protein [Betaproteobacteria bacterium]